MSEADNINMIIINLMFHVITHKSTSRINKIKLQNLFARYIDMILE